MDTGRNIGFIGAGNMAEALINGFISSGLVSPGRIFASDKVKERLLRLAERYEITVYNKNYEVAANSDIIFLTIKPQDVEAALKDIAELMDETKLIVSVMAGKTIDTLHSFLERSGVGTHPPIIRAMPNTPALIREGAIGLYAEGRVKEEDVTLVKRLFGSVGVVVELEEEGLLNTVTALSGSGPAYVFLLIEALIEAGIRGGLTPDDARTLAVQTVAGAGRLLKKTDSSPEELIKRVASPGGTTIAGLSVLEKAGFKDIILKTVEAAKRRAEELAEED